MIEVKFIDKDAVDVKVGGTVLTCFRANLDGTWHPVWVERDGGQRENAHDVELSDEVLHAIRVEETRQVRQPSAEHDRGDHVKSAMDVWRASRREES